MDFKGFTLALRLASLDRVVRPRLSVERCYAAICAKVGMHIERYIGLSSATPAMRAICTPSRAMA